MLKNGGQYTLSMVSVKQQKYLVRSYVLTTIPYVAQVGLAISPGAKEEEQEQEGVGLPWNHGANTGELSIEGEAFLSSLLSFPPSLPSFPPF